MTTPEPLRVSYSHWGMIEIPDGLALMWLVPPICGTACYSMASN